jgi:hypothetical protein
MRHHHPISRLRDGTPGRDRAILDLLHFQELGLVPGPVPVRYLRHLWSASQPQVSRRMVAVAKLGIYRIQACGGFYLVADPSEPRQPTNRERYEAARRQLQEVLSA